MRIICLDVGSKRIGVAISDDLMCAAHPLTVIERRGSARDLARIVTLCREREADCVVVGLPLDEDGGIGPAAARILRFVESLKNALGGTGLVIPVETWDERYSTARAQEVLLDADVSRVRRRRVVDKLAAAMILNDYMEHNERKRSP